MLDPARLVFIDETAVTTNMARLRGRAASGVRLIGRVPLGEWKTITFVAALRHVTNTILDMSTKLELARGRARRYDNRDGDR